jgi:predicted DNA-binding antitoxin AbrB/MazE fold protein
MERRIRIVLASLNGPCYCLTMTTTVEAIYENGTLRLPRPLPLQDKAQVVVTIQTKAGQTEADERKVWLKKSEETLMKAWDNPDDDVFNELLDR